MCVCQHGDGLHSVIWHTPRAYVLIHNGANDTPNHTPWQEAAVLDAKDSLLETTAEPRPNAYVPEALSIPKPFGAFAPFKPAAPGAAARCGRAPAAREIVI